MLKNRKKRKHLAHIVAGVVILIHSYDKYESGHGPYDLFAVAGCIFLAVALFHPVIQKKLPWIDGVFFSIEGSLSLIVAYDAFCSGKKAVPTAYLLLGLFQFFIAFRRSKKGVKQHTLNHQT